MKVTVTETYKNYEECKGENTLIIHRENHEYVKSVFTVSLLLEKAAPFLRVTIGLVLAFDILVWLLR